MASVRISVYSFLLGSCTISNLILPLVAEHGCMYHCRSLRVFRPRRSCNWSGLRALYINIEKKVEIHFNKYRQKMQKRNAKTEKRKILFQNRLKTFLLAKINNFIYIWIALNGLYSNLRLFHIICKRLRNIRV